MPRNRSEKVPDSVSVMIVWALLCEKRGYTTLLENGYDVSKGYNALPQVAQDEITRAVGGNYRRKALYVFKKYGRSHNATQS